jgi:hypothetical protein
VSSWRFNRRACSIFVSYGCVLRTTATPIGCGLNGRRDGAVQAEDEFVHLGSRALPHALADLDGFGDLLAIGSKFEGFTDVVVQTGLTVCGDGRADGDQFEDAIIEIHGGSFPF